MLNQSASKAKRQGNGCIWSNLSWHDIANYLTLIL